MPRTELERPSALIVEDEAVVGIDLKRTLERLGISVLGIVGTSEQALRLACELEPDLVLLDIRLRGEHDGIWVGQELRSRIDTSIVYLSAQGDDVTLGRASATRPDGYLVKPVEPEAFEQLIEGWLERRAQRHGERA